MSKSDLDNFLDGLKASINEYIDTQTRTALTALRTKSIDEIAKIVGVTPVFEPSDFPQTSKPNKPGPKVRTATIDYAKVVTYATQNGRVSNGDVCRMFHVNPTRAWRELSAMVSKGMLVKSGTHNTTFYVVRRNAVPARPETAQTVTPRVQTKTKTTKTATSKVERTRDTKKRIADFLKTRGRNTFTTNEFAKALNVENPRAIGHLNVLSGQKKVRPVTDADGDVVRSTLGDIFWRRP